MNHSLVAKESISQPHNWKVGQISDIVIRTKQLNTKNIFRTFKYIDVSSINRSSLKIKTTTNYNSDNAPSRAKKIVHTDDVIIATVRPTLKRIAYIDANLDNQICSTAFCVLRVNRDKMDPKFLYFYLQRREFIDTLGALQKGASYPSVTDSIIKSQFIAFPPLPEQKKIASILSTIQEAREKTEAVIEAARELKKSMMKHLFTYGPVPVSEAENVKLKETEIGLVPEEWEIKPLEELFEFSRKPRELKPSAQQRIPFIPMELIPENGSEVSWIEKEFKNITSGTYVEKGDLIVGKITPCFENGKQTILTNLPSEFSYATTEVWALHPNEYKRLSVEILSEYLSQGKIRNELTSKMEGATGRQRLPRHVLKNILLPVPSQSEQNEMITIFDTIHSKIESESKKKVALESLFQSMLQKLMTGELSTSNKKIAL